jgi:hypothetical protein
MGRVVPKFEERLLLHPVKRDRVQITVAPSCGGEIKSDFLEFEKYVRQYWQEEGEHFLDLLRQAILGEEK